MILVSSVLFCFCSCSSKGISEQAIVLRMGVDYKDDTFIISLKTLSVQSATAEEEISPVPITVVGNSIESALNNASLLLESKLYFSHADSIIIGKSISDNITPIVDYLNSNSDLRQSTAIFIADNAKEIIYNEEDKIHPLDLTERVETAGEKITEIFELNRKLENDKIYSMPYLSMSKNENGRTYAILNKKAFFDKTKLIEIK